MTYVTSNGLNSIAKRMLEFGNEFANTMEHGIVIEKAGKFIPRVDISEEGTMYIVHVELAGIKKEDVSISINEDRVLSIKGKKEKYSNLDKARNLKNERIFGEFTRSFILPEQADINKVFASFENGILELKIAKLEEVAPKEIKIEIQ